MCELKFVNSGKIGQIKILGQFKYVNLEGRRGRVNIYSVLLRQAQHDDVLGMPKTVGAEYIQPLQNHYRRIFRGDYFADYFVA